MSRISILNASAKDFAVEVVSSLPSGTSHEDGRIVKLPTLHHLKQDFQAKK